MCFEGMESETAGLAKKKFMKWGQSRQSTQKKLCTDSQELTDMVQTHLLNNEHSSECTSDLQ